MRKKLVVTVLGEDRPGIVYSVSSLLRDLSCNIVEVSQTILGTEFAGIFVVTIPEKLTREGVEASLGQRLTPDGLNISVKDYKTPAAVTVVQAEPFVITLRGPDRLGLIPDMTEVIARHRVNIANLKAIAQQDDPTQVVLAFEVDVPQDIDRSAFRSELRARAEELGMEMNLQHQDIFEAIHRI
jgi:glycine cleavage system transcriptional repressor